MKTEIRVDKRDNFYIPVSDEVMIALGWHDGDEVSIDIPVTGGGLRIYKEADPIKLMGGVKEVING